MNDCVWRRIWRLQEDALRRGTIDHGWQNPQTKEELWDYQKNGRHGNYCTGCGVFPSNHK